jgi:hypothetical protein
VGRVETKVCGVQSTPNRSRFLLQSTLIVQHTVNATSNLLLILEHEGKPLYAVHSIIVVKVIARHDIGAEKAPGDAGQLHRKEIAIEIIERDDPVGAAGRCSSRRRSSCWPATPSRSPAVSHARPELPTHSSNLPTFTRSAFANFSSVVSVGSWRTVSTRAR